jgi:hypothetical protein
VSGYLKKGAATSAPVATAPVPVLNATAAEELPVAAPPKVNLKPLAEPVAEPPKAPEAAVLKASGN